MLNDFLRCIGANLRRFVSSEFVWMLVAFMAIFLIGYVAILIFAAVTGQWEVVPLAMLALALFVLALFGIWLFMTLIAILINCGMAVMFRTLDAGAAGAPTTVGQALASGAVATCESARALLALAQAALAAAQAARDAQAERVAEARRRVHSATNMLVAAIASAAAAIFQPWAIVGAVAAVVAAVALIARRARQLAQELGALSLREAELLRAVADVAAAEALVAVLCATSPTDSPSNGPGLLAGGRVPVSVVTP